MKGDDRAQGHFRQSLAKVISWPIIWALCLYVFLCLVVFASFPNIFAIKCTLEFEQDGEVEVFYKSALRNSSFQPKYSRISGKVHKNEKKTVVVFLPDSPVESLRIDPGHFPGIIKLYSVHLVSHFGKRCEFGPSEIFSLFEPGTDNVKMHLAEDHVRIVADTVDPYIVSRGRLMSRPWFLICAFPLPFALLFFFYLREKDWSKLVLFTDLSEKRPATGSNIDGLDGLRGLAAIMVVADHSWGRFTGLGAGGVWIFMALSGFLLARPFAADPGRIVSIPKMKHFYGRRCRRILPAYYTYITLVYLLSTRFDTAIKHFLFLQGAGHLWVIPQEIMFYLLIPVVLLLNYILFKGNWWLSFLFTAGMVVVANIYLTADVFSLYGMHNQELRLFVGVFLSGVACAYLFEHFSNLKRFHEEYKRKITPFCSALGLFLLLFFLLGSTARLWGGMVVYAQIYFVWFGIAAALLVLCIVFSEGTLLARLLTWQPLRSLGVVSLSFYIFHPLVLSILSKGQAHFTGDIMSGPSLFVSTLLLSYLLARFVYFNIEKPFMK